MTTSTPLPLDRRELGAWLRLVETPGVGRASVRALLAAFGSPEAVVEASPAARRAVVAPAVAAALAEPPAGLAALLDATCRWLDAGSAAVPRSVVVLGDPRYPGALLEAPDPPSMLYAQGRVERLSTPSIAVVGSRAPTPQGRENARAFAAHFAGAGWTVVSGLALGIDTAAHLGALDAATAPAARGRDGADGMVAVATTIAVVGTGLDIVYPRVNLALAHRIAAEGLLLSEYAIGTPPLATNFPRRNRIIAGLARGTLVVEAALRSGSLITARLANEAGRDVFAIPGSIRSPLSQGAHALIRQGARLVESPAEVLDDLVTPGVRAGTDTAAAAPRPAAANPPGGLLDALGHDPVTLDALVARTDRSAAELAAELLTLELDGRVARLPGQLFQRLDPG